MDLRYALQLIISEGKEVDAIKILLDSLSGYADACYNNLLDCRDRLRTIKAINGGKNKDIHNLCCEEDKK